MVILRLNAMLLKDLRIENIHSGEQSLGRFDLVNDVFLMPARKDFHYQIIVAFCSIS